MEDEYIEELIRRSIESNGGVPLNEIQKKAIEEYLAKRGSSEFAKAFAQDATATAERQAAAGAARSGFLSRLLPYARVIWLIPVYMLIALIWDSQQDTRTLNIGKGACSTHTPGKTLKVSVSFVGPKSAMNRAIDEINSQCAASGVSCIDPSCPTCGPDVAINTIDIHDYILWYTADVTGTCQCWCK
jgi:hypothetical protein